MQMNFCVQSWSAWSNSRPDKDHWQAWAAGSTIEAGAVEAKEAKKVAPDLSSVPAMQRRRMSSVTRMAIATASDCLGELSETPLCVFATRHGESERTIKIMNAIGQGIPVSPTDFSLSVHNTALGLYSIFSGNKLPATTVVSNKNIFDTALIETAIHQQRFPDSPVLLVVFDAPPPPPISTLNVGPEEAYSIALLLSNDSGCPVSGNRELLTGYSDDSNEVPENLAYDFLRFLLSDTESASLSDHGVQWRWRKKE